MLAGLSAFGVISQGLLNMVGSRRWQCVWLVASSLAVAMLSLLATLDLGVLSKKFF